MSARKTAPVRVTPRVLRGLQHMRAAAQLELDSGGGGMLTEREREDMARAIEWFDRVLEPFVAALTPAAEPGPASPSGPLVLTPEERQQIRAAHDAKRAEKKSGAETGISTPPGSPRKRTS